MDQTATPAASAQPTDAPTPPAPSAAHAAAAAGDFSKFREASRAERRGDPLPAPAPATATPPKAPAAAAAPAQPAGADPKAPSKRQLTLNEQIRTAVDRATTELRAENEQLRRGQAPPAAPRSAAEPTARPPAPAQPAIDPKDPEPDASDLKTYPGGEYDPKYVRDQARWAARDEHRKGERAAHERAAKDAYEQHTHAVETTFAERMTKAREADPTFLDRLSPDVANLRPMWALGPTETATAANALATLVMQSEVSTELMLHLSEHPDDFQQLAQARDGYALERAFGRLEARLEKAAAPPPAPLKHVSSAPPPTPSLGTRPADPTNAVAGAVQRRNFADFRRAKDAERRARTKS